MVKISHKKKRFQRSTHFDRFVNNLDLLKNVILCFHYKSKLLAFDVGDYYGYIIMQAENPSEPPSSSKIP
jgi:hypothetical protein